MAFRLADLRMYPALGLTNHPGVPFYIMNWLALAIAGYPVASSKLAFFHTVIEHVGDYQKFAIFLASFTGAAGTYILARSAQALVPFSVTLVGSLIWLVSTPATITAFLSPSNETFALFLNALFLSALIMVAYAEKTTNSIAVFAGCVGA